MPVASLFLLTTLSMAPPASGDVLPLRKLRLYETGVGYFERHGGVAPDSDVGLPLPASHLDDALKTLVIIDASGDTRVQGVQFATAVSENGARAMAGLPEEYDGDEIEVAYVDVLESLEGSRVEVRHDGGRTRGTLIEIEGPFSPPPRRDASGNEIALAPGEAPPEPWHAVVMLDEDGGVHRLRTTTISSVKALDESTHAHLQVAAESLSDRTARRAHPLSIEVSSSGQLGLGYIAESPVWRTTYRVVLSSQAPGAEPSHDAELQAWALVHNDTDEDWTKVALELANGRPQSFLYPLAAPRYAWRELTGPEDALSTVPQLANSTADRMWGDSYGVGGLGLVGTGRGGGGTGDGTIGLGNTGLIGHGGGGGMGMAGPRIGDLADLSQAEGEESGSLFVYRVADPIDLAAHHSALVPIVQQTIEAESITWFPAEDWQALTGARVLNSTTQTLPPGVVSFFGDGAFIGETALHRLKPRERQFVVFGTEQDVELDRYWKERSRTTVGLEYHGEQLAVHERRVRDLTLTLSNRSGRTRRVYAALDAPRNATIERAAGAEDVALDFDLETNAPLAIVSVGAGAELERSLTVETMESRRVDAKDVETLQALSETDSLPQAQRDRLRTAVEHRRLARAERKKVEALRDRLARHDAELERLRRDLEALGRVRLRGRVAKRLAKDLLRAERRVEDLRDEIKETKRSAAAQERRATQALAALDRAEP